MFNLTYNSMILKRLHIKMCTGKISVCEKCLRRTSYCNRRLIMVCWNLKFLIEIYLLCMIIYILWINYLFMFSFWINFFFSLLKSSESKFGFFFQMENSMTKFNLRIDVNFLIPTIIMCGILFSYDASWSIFCLFE